MGGAGSGRKGLSPQTVQHAERLLRSGWGAYCVSKRLSIAVSTVYRIRAGEHFLQLALDQQTADRCPGCGALVERLPCLLCELRQAGL